jgi:hypothetical protein
MAHSGCRDIGVEGSASRSGRFTPGKDRVPIVQEVGLAQGSVRKISLSPEFDPRTVQPVINSLYRLSYPAHNYDTRTHKYAKPDINKISVN